MIEALADSVLLGYLSPIALFTAAICFLVLRVGGSQVFFDIVGTFQATRMIDDAKSAATVFEALYLDTLTSIQDSAMQLADMFNSVTDSVVPIARELAEAEIQLEKFLDTSEDISQVRDDIESIGVNFAFAGDQAMQAAAKMAQISGVLGPGSLAVGTQIGMEFGLISGMETEAAMQRMINLQQQTEFMTENLEANMTAEERATQIRKDSMRVLDQLNTIENRSAATMEQITFVMNQFASQAHLANEEIKTMAAMSAVMIETGEEQGKGGRALRMMYARLGSDIGGAATELKNLDIAITDANGDMRGLSDILKELEPQFKEMDGARKQEIAQVVAGNRHYTRFLKIMNNLDRVKALELEATLAMFPAMEEIERRRESELFQLEQAEAKVTNLSAALGDKLIPAMTETTNKQAMMIEAFLEFTRVPLFGKAALSMFEFSKAASVVVGPILSTVIGIKSLSIAAKTHAAVLRALNEPTKLLNHNFRATSTITKESAKDIQLYEMSLSMLNEEMRQTAIINRLKFHQEKLSSKFAGMKDQEIRAEITQLKRIMNLKNQDTKKNKARLRMLRTELALRKKLRVEKELEKKELKIDNAKKQAQNLNKLTGGFLGAGSAMMLFSRNQSVVTAGMGMMTGAMALQTFKAINLQENFIKLTKAGLAHRNIMAAQATNTQILTSSMVGAGIAAKSLIASLAPFLAAAAGLILLHKALKDFGFIGKEAKEETEELTTAAADMGAVADMIGEVNQGTLDVTKALAEQEAKIKTLRQSNSSMYDEVLAAEEQRYANLQRTNDILLQQTTMENMDQNALNQYFAAVDEESRLIERYGDQTKLTLGNAMDITFQQHGRALLNFGKTVPMIEAARDAQSDFAKEFPKVYEFIERHGIKTQKDFNYILTGTGETFSEAGMEAGKFLDDITAVKDEVAEFSNAREELFFGSRSNMTGDLIRQVQQQGVETLITSTEVVMTNVFNGLTIPEMADMVIEEIESRGRSNGYNIV